MESQRVADEQGSSPLLRPDNDIETEGGDGDKYGSSATTVVVFSTLVAVLGSYVFGCAIGFSSPAQSGILDDLGLSLAESAWMLDTGRLLTGYGIGLLSYVVPVYIAEIAPKNLRGAFTAVNQLMICCGSSVMYLVGNVFTWRTLAWIGAIPCLLQLVGLFFIPESPRWLAKMGRWDDSKAALQCFRGENADVFEEAAEIRDYTQSLGQLSDSRMIDLFQRKYAHSLIVGVGLMVLQQFGGVNAIAYYASSIFSSAGTGTTAMVFIQVPMTLLGVLLMDKSGRRLLLLVSAAGTCLGCFLIGLSFLLQDLQLWKSSPLLALRRCTGNASLFVLQNGCTQVFTGFLSLGMGGIPWVIMSEIFPINVKGLAGSLVTVVNWLGSWIISYSFNFLMQWSSEGTFFIFSAVSGITVIFIAKLVPETKGQNKLGEATITLEDMTVLGCSSILGDSFLSPCRRRIGELRRGEILADYKVKKARQFAKMTKFMYKCTMEAKSEHEAFLAHQPSRLVFPIFGRHTRGINVCPIVGTN
ncbi:Sugar transporter ERD6-like 5 [Abeliophyllum distichum]|uniref:Sugar transporter ERD6-like 5 n=1 Tax=Abeliophyllum distichum TaxID=126358 RepID=A0ABD1TGF8_9LAMI